MLQSSLPSSLKNTLVGWLGDCFIIKANVLTCLNLKLRLQYFNNFYIENTLNQREAHQEFMKPQLMKAMSEVHRTLSLALQTVEEIYNAHNIQFHFQKETTLRTFMSMVTPVVQHKLNPVHKAPQFPSNKTPYPNNPRGIEDNQQTKTLESRLTNLSQKIFDYNEYKQKQIVQQSKPVETKPRMMSILNQIKTSRDEGNNYYKGPSAQRINKIAEKVKKSTLTYPTMRAQYQDHQVPDKEKCALGSKVEVQINRWVVRQISKGRKVTRHELVNKALSMRENPAFKASRQWIASYFKRYPQIKSLISSCQSMQSSSSESREESESKYEMSKFHSHQSSEYESYEELNGHKKYRQKFKQNQFTSKQDDQVDNLKQDDKAVYEDGQKKIIIYKGITNQLKQSRYTSGRRNKKSYVNGNGFNFKNHSRFKDAYFSDLNKNQQVNSVIIVKTNQDTQKAKSQMEDQHTDKKQKSVCEKGDPEKNQPQNGDNSEKNTTKSRRKNDYDSKLKSYLNLMKYETIRTKQ